MAKSLMRIAPATRSLFAKTHVETGMGLQIVSTPAGIVIVLGGSTALPCYTDPRFYDVADVLAGEPIPHSRDDVSLQVVSAFAGRAAAFTALRKARVSPAFTGTAGAIPLIGSDTLAASTVFYRCISTATDHRFIAGQLTAGTYLTTALDKTYINSGYGTVGRFALPLPIPASTVIEYELPKGTAIDVGTVAPMFGQSGGGVEVQLPAGQPAVQVGITVMSDY